MKKYQIRHSQLVLFTVFFIIMTLASCTPPSMNQQLNANDSSPLTIDPDNFDELNPMGSPSDNSSDSPQALPTTEIPLPALTADNVIAFAPDSSDYVPVAGTIESQYTSSDHFVALSYPSATASRHGNLFFDQAFADELPNICLEEGVTCCPLNSDNSFECFMPLENASTQSITLAVLDLEGNPVVSDTNLTLNPNLLYTAQPLISVAPSLSDFLAISASEGVAFDSTSPSAWASSLGFAIAGDHDISYNQFAHSGSKINFSPIDNIFAVSSAQSLQVFDANSLTSISSASICTRDDPSLNTKFIKSLNGVLYCFPQLVSEVDSLNLYDVAGNSSFRMRDRRTSFLEPSDNLLVSDVTAADGARIDDIDYNLFALKSGESIVFELVKILNNISSQKYFSNSWNNTDISHIADIQFYKTDTVNSTFHFALLDDLQRKIWFGYVNYTTGEFHINEDSALAFTNPVTQIEDYNGNLIILDPAGASFHVIMTTSNSGQAITSPYTGASFSLGSLTAKSLLPSGFSIQNDVLMVTDYLNPFAMIIPLNNLSLHIEPDVSPIFDESNQSENENSNPEEPSAPTDTEGLILIP